MRPRIYRTYTYYRPPSKYGVFDFLTDVFMTLITCFFWLIWIYVREMRNSR